MVQSGYRPKRDLHSVFFPFGYYMSLNTYKLYDADDSLFLSQVCRNIKYDIRRECKCGLWSCIVFGNLLDEVYKFMVYKFTDMPYYNFIESL